MKVGDKTDDQLIVELFGRMELAERSIVELQEISMTRHQADLLIEQNRNIYEQNKLLLEENATRMVLKQELVENERLFEAKITKKISEIEKSVTNLVETENNSEHVKRLEKAFFKKSPLGRFSVYVFEIMSIAFMVTLLLVFASVYTDIDVFIVEHKIITFGTIMLLSILLRRFINNETVMKSVSFLLKGGK